jgi:ABC-2 type transport system permease protein
VPKKLKELSLAWMLGWKDVLIMGQSRALMVFVVVMPLVMVCILGLALMGLQPRSTTSKLALVNLDGGPVGAAFEQVVKDWPQDTDNGAGAHVEFLKDPLSAEDAERRLGNGELNGALLLPAGLSDRVGKGGPAEVELRLPPGSPPDRTLLQMTVDGLALRVWERREPGAPQLAVQTESQEGPGPAMQKFTSFSQSVAGNGVMFILFNCILIGGLSLVRERRAHTLDRLMIAPISRGTVVLGKVLGVYIMGLIQAVVILGFGFLIGAGVYWWNAVGVGLVTLMFILVGCALGLMIAALAPSEEAVQVIGSPVALILTTLGGGMFPLELGPQWMQTAARCLPTGWAMFAYHTLMWQGTPQTALATLVSIVPNLLVLAGFAAVFLVIGVLSLRWE